MQTIKLSKTNPDPKIINAALKILKQGGVLVYPTETAYALGCDWTNKKAKEKIYKIKGRKASKKLPVIVADLKMAKRYAKFDAISERLAKKHWPGALTLVLEYRRDAPWRVCTGPKFNLALRVSSHKIARLLSKKLGKPIVSTSANVSGKGNCYSLEEILKQFKNKKYQPDLILDVGKLRKVGSSTIVKVIAGELKILRQGSIRM